MPIFGLWVYGEFRMKAGERGDLSPRLRQVVDLLPKHQWQVKPAAIEAGYSESYADRLSAILKRNVRFYQAVEARRQEFMEATGWNVEKWQQECAEQYERAKTNGDWPAICQLLKMLGQHTGSFAEDNRQRGDQLAIVMR
jgi:hypothetical protein